MTADYEAFRFNTMVAKLMELTNVLFRYRGTSVAGRPAWDEAIRLLLLMLAPAAPHITEELWSRLADAARRGLVVDPHAALAGGRRGRCVEATREVPVQVNGKVRDRVMVPAGISEIELEQIVLARDKVRAALGGKQPHGSSTRAAAGWSTSSSDNAALTGRRLDLRQPLALSDGRTARSAP